MGSCFDTASVAEIEMALAAGATPDRISFGNTIKKERDIARAYELGIRLFAVDCVEEVEKIARVRAGREGVLPHLTDGAGAEWPLSRKFGCVPEMASTCSPRPALGLEAYGVSFHVGSQQTRSKPGTARWRRQEWSSRARRRARHQRCSDGQHGRRFPDQVPQGRAGRSGLWPGDLRRCEAFRQPHSGDHHRAGPRHGRQCRRDQDGSRADLEEVDNDNHRWVYLDIGKFGGLAETMDEAIRYPIRHERDGDEMAPPACSPARPAIRPTCSTRRRRIRCRCRARSATRC
jgi:ornithine decarboxylase